MKRGKLDGLDGAAAAVMALAGIFALTFLWQTAASSASSEKDYRERIRLVSEKRINKEREQIAFLIDRVATKEVWEEAVEAEGRFEGNSQLHLFLAEGYRERGQLGTAIGQFRMAVEANRDYTDRRSPFYRGETLKDVVREGRALYLAQGRPAARWGGRLRDLFYIERALAGGCH